MFWYTKEFADVTTDIPLFISQVIAQTNQGYINSKVPVRVKAHCAKQVDFAEVFDGNEMLDIFTASKPAEDLLNTADVAHLLVINSSFCGLAVVFDGFDTIRTKKNFSFSKKRCDFVYTFAHEVGHNFGLLHDKYELIYSANPPYPYGLGHHIPGTPFMTIMAYERGPNIFTVNYYSAPNVYLPPNGELTGSELLDSARVLRENRFAMAAVGDESGICSSSGYTGTGSTGTVQSENYPSNYDNNLDKTYNIEVGSGNKIRISFDDLDIEYNGIMLGCRWDYVSVKDSDGEVLVENTCGDIMPGVVTSNTNKVEVIFHSDFAVTKRGFKLTWAEV